ncbi:hypothetical protein PVAND_000772 [Polypedilum vanderplanki]|uniref:LRRCT domain-containing protein n=1 Tax=Polypedilum vanderplanki TaxID=319348 RepID=A0A9J6BKV2_POLVA|nr:hypothetical protein PVAND_000772 [Polypedilum vanderplanki]
MKIQKVDLNDKTYNSKRNRCYRKYHNCTNSSHCNKIFGVIFIMSIGGIFIGSIILAFIRADMIPIDFNNHNHIMNLSENALTSSNEIPVMPSVDSSNEDLTTESLKIEEVLETLSDVFDESTTTTTEEYQNTKAKDEDSKESTAESNPPIEENSTTESIETSDTETTTEESTSTTTPKRPNSCTLSMSNNDSDVCIISCSEVSSSYLSYDINETLELHLNDYEDCAVNEFDLDLKRIDFDDGNVDVNFLADLQVSIHYLTIKNSTVRNIASDALVNVKKFVIESTFGEFFFARESFKGLSNIETLHLSNFEKIDFVSVYSLNPMNNSLRELKINNVRNSWNVDKLLMNTTLFKIKTVNFQNNNFDDLTFNASTFSRVCGSIKTLNLDNCKIKNLSADVFGYCPFLTLLELMNNNIETLPVGIFDNLPSLKELYLNNNKFTSIPYGLFDAVLNSSEIKNIDLSNNEWHCDFDIIYLKQILTTHGNIITINECETPEEFNGLIIKDLWCTFDSCTIYCENLFNSEDLSNSLVAYNEVNCAHVHLRIRNQSLLNKIESNWLSHLKFNIHSLSISKSYIEKIESEAFNSEFFEKLIELEISENESDPFIIYANSLAGLKSLESLKIENAAVITLTSGDRDFLEPLKASLYELSITGIKSNLKYYDIFERYKFDKLKVLKMHGNSFSNYTLMENSFYAMKDSLEEIYLNDSQISKATNAAFSEFHQLKVAHLENNELAFLSSEFFGDLVNDSEFQVYLSGNPWNCTCGISHLLDIIKEETVICDSPKDVKGLEITILDEMCRSTITETSLSASYNSSTITEEMSSTEETTKKNTKTSGTFTVSSTTSTTSEEITTTSSITKTTTTTESTTSITTTDSSNNTTSTNDENISDTTTLESGEEEENTSPSDSTDDQNDTTESSTLPITDNTTDPSIFTTKTTKTSIKPSSSSTQSMTTPCVYTTPPVSQSTPIGSESIIVQCFETGINNSAANLERLLTGLQLIRTLNSRDPITIFRPIISFDIKTSSNHEEVIVEFKEGYDDEMVLVYYPSMEDPFKEKDMNAGKDIVKCISVTNPIIIVNQLLPDTIYNFCALYRNPYHMMITPFQCKSHIYLQGHPWLYEEQKAIIITSFILLLLLALIIGVITTYFLIRRMPTLIRGSKRVVMVNNRTKEVMILPRTNSDATSNNSCRKESIPPITAEPPTYLTPLPRQSFDNRPPFVRSNSDTSIKSYVSVSRLPPRFSQVFQRSDFECDSPRRCGSYPHCHPSAPCCHQHSPELPPPLPRRSVVSTASSTLRSNASTAEIGKPLSRASVHNSTYRRHPRPIEIEHENHYNFII